MMMVGSLDQRYLEFHRKTSKVFAQFPGMEPLRFFIFKELLVQGKSATLIDCVKQWCRPLIRRGRTIGPLKQATILIWLESGREVIRDALLPVFHELLKRGENVQLVSFDGPDDLPPVTTRFQYRPRALTPTWAKIAWQALCEVEPALSARSSERVFYHACADVQGLFEEMNRLLRAIEPRVVVSASTQLMGGSASMVGARDHSIATVLLQHGILQPVYVPLLADVMCTWGEESNQILTRLGIESERVQALGSPRHDAMVPSFTENAKRRLLRSLSLEDRPTFVFFSNGNDLLRNGSAPLECARWLEEAAAKYAKSLNIVVRLHPNEDGSLYRGSHHLIITKGSSDVRPLLDGCDWVGSLCSTALYDALLYRKPVWQFQADGWPELANNWQKGLARRISSASELIAMTGRMLETSAEMHATSNFVGNVFSNHGRATEAVTDFIVTHVKSQTRDQ